MKSQERSKKYNSVRNQSFSLSPFSAASFGRSPASGWWAGQPPRCLRPSGWGSGKSPGCKNPETSQEAGSASFGTHRPVIKLNKCNFLDDIFHLLKSCSFFVWIVLTLQLHNTIKSVRFAKTAFDFEFNRNILFKPIVVKIVKKVSHPIHCCPTSLRRCSRSTCWTSSSRSWPLSFRWSSEFGRNSRSTSEFDRERRRDEPFPRSRCSGQSWTCKLKLFWKKVYRRFWSYPLYLTSSIIVQKLSVFRF